MPRGEGSVARPLPDELIVANKSPLQGEIKRLCSACRFAGSRRKMAQRLLGSACRRCGFVRYFCHQQAWLSGCLGQGEQRTD